MPLFEGQLLLIVIVLSVEVAAWLYSPLDSSFIPKNAALFIFVTVLDK